MKRYLWIYILVSVFVAVWGIRALTRDSVITQTARVIEYERKINAEGMIVRNETVYKAKSAGMAEASYQNETRVAKGKKIATIYTDGIDPDTKQALDAVNAKIRRLEKKNTKTVQVGADLSSAEERIGAAVASIVEMTHTGNYEEFDLTQTEIGAYVNLSEGETQVNPTQEALDDLYAEKATLEASVQSAKQDVYSSMAGVFVSETDGYEDSITPQAVQSMSVSDYEAIEIENEPYVPESLNSGDRVCKVVDNTNWYFATVIPEAQLDGMEMGDAVWLRFPDKSNARLSATVEHISSPDGGKVLVLVACGYYIEGIYSIRNTACEIVTHVYEGYQLPQAAVRVDEEGNTGVYINVSGIVKFRNINILYQNDSQVIAAKSDENGFIKQYDSVIVGGKNIYAGAVVK